MYDVYEVNAHFKILVEIVHYIEQKRLHEIGILVGYGHRGTVRINNKVP
jgi:hypothetical protein